ncbi:MAG: hypothetical protein WD532_11855 [Acidimicrobiia bacterium]
MSVAGLVRSDLANLRRDPMLMAAGLAPVLIAALIGFGFEPLTNAAAGDIDLAVHRPLFVAGALLLTPLLIGFVVGFLLVEEGEERILDAVAVTSRGRDGFLRHRLMVPAVVGSVTAGGVGLVLESLGWPRLVAVAVLAGGTAVLVTLTIATLARDRVQALVVSKLTGFLLVAAVAFQFIEGWWRIPFGLVPATWVVETVVAEVVWPGFVLGLGTHGVVGALLWRRIRRLHSV